MVRHIDPRLLSAGTSLGRILIWSRADKNLVGSMQSPKQMKIWSAGTDVMI
jgi:hypothetical protein